MALVKQKEPYKLLLIVNEPFGLHPKPNELFMALFLTASFQEHGQLLG
jgi:hypothetical protein